MPAMKENSESSESFGSIANGEVTTPAEVVAGERNSISFPYAAEVGFGVVKPSWLVGRACVLGSCPPFDLSDKVRIGHVLVITGKRNQEM